MISFGQFKETRANQVVGVCTDKPAFRELTNEACERLMTRGSFWATTAKLKTCVQCQSIVWPRMVLVPLAVNLCGRNVMTTGYWSEWLPMSGADYFAARGFGMFGYGGMGRGIGCGDVVVRNGGEVPVQAPLKCNEPRYVRAFPAYQSDLGKTITLFGIDANGQTIMTKRDDGAWREGVVLTLASPYVGTSFQIRTITRVLKDATEGPVRLYAYDAVNDVLEDLAYYTPSERSPSFQQSTIRGLRNGGSCNGLTSVTALVQLRFVPVETDEDLVQIDNWTALKLQMLSIRAEDAGDTAEALQLQARAVHELNLELRNHLPVDQIPISITPFGTATPRSVGVGLII